MMLLRLARHILKRSIREHLPRLENSLTVAYDPATLTEDERLILLRGVAKDPGEARRIMQEYGAANAVELLAMLPKPKINVRRRVKRWLLGLEGSHLSDPTKDKFWPPNHSQNYIERRSE